MIVVTSLLIFSQPSKAQSPSFGASLTEDSPNKKLQLYQSNIQALERYRISQAAKYKNASNKNKQDILIEVKSRLENELTQNIFPAWHGTPWNFHGTSTTPGQGKIACGYFVSTSLVHIGFKVNRIKLAQQPSQRIIRTFMKKSAMDISSRRSLPNIKKQLLKSGDGIYIVGLDTHVGFVIVKNNTITFTHSSYYSNPTKCVKTEPYNSKNPLADSKYRVFGKLFHPQMLINWLQAHPYQVAQ